MARIAPVRTPTTATAIPLARATTTTTTATAAAVAAAAATTTCPRCFEGQARRVQGVEVHAEPRARRVERPSVLWVGRIEQAVQAAVRVRAVIHHGPGPTRTVDGDDGAAALGARGRGGGIAVEGDRLEPGQQVVDGVERGERRSCPRVARPRRRVVGLPSLPLVAASGREEEH